MRWVLITAFGVPVEPEVNRNFAIVSGPTAAKAFGDGIAFRELRRSTRNEIASPLSASPLTMTAVCSGLIAASAAANGLVPET